MGWYKAGHKETIHIADNKETTEKGSALDAVIAWVYPWHFLILWCTVPIINSTFFQDIFCTSFFY